MSEEKISVTVSPLSSPTVTGAGSAAVADTNPGQHSTAPSVLPSGNTQSWQFDAEVAPTTALAVFAEHCVQSLIDDDEFFEL